MKITNQNLPVVAMVKEVKINVNHIAVVDVSGSMSYDLAHIRNQLKTKLYSLLDDGDTISIVYFSGRGQYGVALEGCEIRSLKDFSTIHQAIDKHIQPIGMTGFKEPLETVGSIISKLEKSRPESVFSLFFMTDGYDNQWSKKEILDVAEKLSSKLVHSVIVEYGWNCNRALLSEMAEVMGGSQMFSENFEQYDEIFQDAMQRKLKSVKKKEVILDEEAVMSYAISYDENGYSTYQVNQGKVLVPENVNRLIYLAEGKGFEKVDDVLVVLASLAPKMNPVVMFDLLGQLESVKIFKKFQNCFSKQDYSDFQALCLESLGQDIFKDGKSSNLVPKDDAFTVLDALEVLQLEDSNKFYPFSPDFGYKKKGPKQINKSAAELMDKTKEMAQQLQNCSNLTEMNNVLTEMQNIKEVKAEFKPFQDNPACAINRMEISESKPNVSIGVTIPGVVHLPVSAQEKGLPSQVNSVIHRNFSIINNGIVHTRSIPVSVGQETFDLLKSEGVFDVNETWEEGKVMIANLENLPVMNRNMVKTANAKQLFEEYFKLMELKATAKVLKSYYAKYEPLSSSKKLVEMFGEENAEYLKGLGLTDGGFSPAKKTLGYEDEVITRELKISIKGLSSLPSVKDAEAALDKAEGKLEKLTLSNYLMALTIKQYRDFVNGMGVMEESQRDEMCKKWLETLTKHIIKQTRAAQKRIAVKNFAVVVGQVWFEDLGSIENTSMDVKLASRDVACKVELIETTK